MNGHTDAMEMKEHASAVNGAVLSDSSNGHAGSEKAILIEKHHRVSLKAAVTLRYIAIGISWASTIASFILGLTATVFAVLNDSQSLFSFGLDSILDCISSIVVLWRFHGGENIYSEERERRACALIGILFVLSAFLLAGKSIWALAKAEHTGHLQVTLIMSAVQVVICMALGATKVIVGHKLESRALITDSIITLVGAVMSIFTLVFSAVYRHNSKLWYLDDSFGLLCSAFLLIYGLRVLWVSIMEARHAHSSESR